MYMVHTVHVHHVAAAPAAPRMCVRVIAVCVVREDAVPIVDAAKANFEADTVQ